MERQILHRLVIALVALGGVIAALAIGFLVLQRQAGPTVVTLADRIDASEALLFIATDHEGTMLGLIHRFESIFGSSTGPRELPPGHRYEIAVTYDGSGSVAWTLYAHNTTNDILSTVTSVHQSTLLSPKDRRLSLGATAFFRGSAPESSDNIVWVNLAALPFPDSPIGTITKAALAHFSHAMAVWGAPVEGTLFLSSEERRLDREAPSVATSFTTTPTLFLEAGDPIGILERFDARLIALDPTLAEGLRGIAKAMVAERLGQSSMAFARSSFLAGPASFVLLEQDAATSFVLAGEAQNEKQLTEGLSALADTAASATVRRLNFFDGENVRTDIVKSSSQVQETGKKNEWTLIRIGSGGMAPLAGAKAKKKYVLTNDPTLVDAVINPPVKSDPPPNVANRMSTPHFTLPVGSFRGSIEIPALETKIAASFPFLGEGLRELLSSTIGENVFRLQWGASRYSHGVKVRWTLFRKTPT